ncbi:MAG: protein kinase, partial [candidate division Zixibacteria bacterium]|nr:protein kinase [candidate division Zixibacteria bacterium]
RIIEKIGAGGMGEVYLADDTKLNRQVALKFLSPYLCQDEDHRKRFTREAQAAAKLGHANIVAIHEVGEYKGRPWFSMENVEGVSFDKLIEEGRLSQVRIIELTVGICNGLRKAHESGIVHRDIKPSNVIVDRDGCPRVLDFGLAVERDADKLTQTGSTLGTVGYMSPEQVEGEEVDARSDLFSLGVVLYELVTGRNPFRRDNQTATLKAILQDDPEPAARYKSGVSDELQGVISKLLEKDPALRYQSAAGVISDLKRIERASGPQDVSRLPGKLSGRMSRILIPGLIVVFAVMIMIFKPWRIEIESGHEAIAAENRLAIMYFDNLADPGDSQSLGEIVANLLITDLSESEYVQVVSSQRLYDILKLLGKEGQKKIDRTVATQVAEKA